MKKTVDLSVYRTLKVEKEDSNNLEVISFEVPAEHGLTNPHHPQKFLTKGK